ncbi:MAG: hypothetical protein QNJ22_21960 [Desulfosarcinaceae bacterium]|nr:hypothetical protein [Desulfosarcinaceae bacterium]
MIDPMRQGKDAPEPELLGQAALHSDGVLKKIAGEIQKGQTERALVIQMMATMVAQHI